MRVSTIKLIRPPMQKEESTAIYRQALAVWGEESQTRVAIEEMAELTKELCKHGRGANNVEHIAEEIADVRIMLEQMVLLHGCEEQVEQYRQFKLRRLSKRIREDIEGTAEDGNQH